MKKLFVVLSLLCPAVALADQSPFGILGRTNQVSIERRQHGNILTRIDLNTRISGNAKVYDVSVGSLTSGGVLLSFSVDSPAPLPLEPTHVLSAFCEGNSVSDLQACTDLRTIVSCNYLTLSQSQKAALGLLLGTCTKTCNTVSGSHPWGETFTDYQWTCTNPQAAECVIVAGMENRIDVIHPAAGCQF